MEIWVIVLITVGVTTSLILSGGVAWWVVKHKKCKRRKTRFSHDITTPETQEPGKILAVVKTSDQNQGTPIATVESHNPPAVQQIPLEEPTNLFVREARDFVPAIISLSPSTSFSYNRPRGSLLSSGSRLEFEPRPLTILHPYYSSRHPSTTSSGELPLFQYYDSYYLDRPVVTRGRRIPPRRAESERIVRIAPTYLRPPPYQGMATPPSYQQAVALQRLRNSIR